MIREKGELAFAEKMLSGRRLLDFGCGDGRFLRLAGTRGWHGIGLESNEELADYCSNRLALNVLHGDLGSLPRTKGPFDLVVCRYVLEHLKDPVATLDQIRSVCAPDALVIIKVPNIDSWQQRLFGDRWFQFRIRDHAHFYDRAVLARLVDRCGFAPLVIDTPFCLVDLVDFSASLAPSLFPQRGLKYLPVAALSLIISIPAALFALIGRGGTLRVIAKMKREK